MDMFVWPCFFILWTVRTSYGEHAPMDKSFPTVDTPSARTFYDDMFSWIQPFSTTRKLLIRTGILLDGERPDLHFKLNPKQMCLLNMSGSSSQTIAWSWDKRGSPKLIGGICTNLNESIFIKAVIQASWACHMHDRIENHIRATIMSSNRHFKWGSRLIIEFF